MTCTYDEEEDSEEDDGFSCLEGVTINRRCPSRRDGDPRLCND
jgi:hypothetical protein